MKTKQIQDLTMEETKSMITATMLDARELIKKSTKERFKKLEARKTLNIKEVKRVAKEVAQESCDSVLSGIYKFIGKKNLRLLELYPDSEKFMAEVNMEELDAGELFGYTHGGTMQRILGAFSHLFTAQFVEVFNSPKAAQHLTRQFAETAVETISHSICFDLVTSTQLNLLEEMEKNGLANAKPTFVFPNERDMETVLTAAKDLFRTESARIIDEASKEQKIDVQQAQGAVFNASEKAREYLYINLATVAGATSERVNAIYGDDHAATVSLVEGLRVEDYKQEVAELIGTIKLREIFDRFTDTLLETSATFAHDYGQKNKPLTARTAKVITKDMAGFAYNMETSPAAILLREVGKVAMA